MTLSALLLGLFLILLALHWFGVAIPALLLGCFALAAGVGVLVGGGIVLGRQG